MNRFSSFLNAVHGYPSFSKLSQVGGSGSAGACMIHGGESTDNILSTRNDIEQGKSDKWGIIFILHSSHSDNQDPVLMIHLCILSTCACAHMHCHSKT
jgi:hypothetical protein